MSFTASFDVIESYKLFLNENDLLHQHFLYGVIQKMCVHKPYKKQEAILYYVFFVTGCKRKSPVPQQVFLLTNLERERFEE